jgi:hypothetical protein
MGKMYVTCTELCMKRDPFVCFKGKYQKHVKTYNFIIKWEMCKLSVVHVVRLIICMK